MLNGATKNDHSQAHVAVTQEDGTIQLRRIQDAKVVWQAEPVADAGPDDDKLFGPRAFDPDGRTLAIMQPAPPRITMIDTQAGRVRGEIALIHPAFNRSTFVEAFRWSRDGRRIAAISPSAFYFRLRRALLVMGIHHAPGEDQTAIAVFDIADGGMWSVATEGLCNSLDFSPDGEHVVAATHAGVVALWDGQGTRICRVTHDAEALVVRFSPDGKTFATGSADGTARVWHAASGEELERFQIGWPFAGSTIAMTAVRSSRSMPTAT